MFRGKEELGGWVGFSLLLVLLLWLLLVVVVVVVSLLACFVCLLAPLQRAMAIASHVS